MGDEHERRYLERVREQHPTIVELDRADPEGPRRTLAAMDGGAPVIYQAHLVADGWGGFPDFLYRCAGNGCPCGGYHYTPWDTKLARSAKPGFLLQLCAYADFLQTMRGYRPERGGVRLRPGRGAAVLDRPLLLLLPPAPALLSRVPAGLGRRQSAGPRARPQLGPLGEDR